MNSFEEARKFAIDSLERAISAHDRGDIFSIEDGIDEYENIIPREEIANNSLLFLTLEIWSGWSDSAVHDWQFYEPLKKNDWPRIAKILLGDLRANREVTNAEILANFSIEVKEKNEFWLSKLWKSISRKEI